MLDLIVERRLKRKLTTVIDSTALESERRQSYIEAARTAGVPVFAIVFDTADDVCRARNKERDHPVPPKILKGQLEAATALRTTIEGEGFDARPHRQPDHGRRPRVRPCTDIRRPSRRRTPCHSNSASTLRASKKTSQTSRAAEQAGFAQLTVMDHFVQIPGVGREWEDMFESYTTLGYLAGITSTMKLGTLVTGITYRNIAHLGKIVATLDVLSRTGAPSAVWAPRGSSANTSSTAGSSRRTHAGTRCSRTRCSCSR